jgi:hypothetical protein
MRFVLLVYLVLPTGSDPRPITIPQSTEASCMKAADKLRADLRAQIGDAKVITACVDQGSAY